MTLPIAFLNTLSSAIALGHDEVSDLIEAYGSKKKDAIKSVDEDDELRKAAIKATSESLRSLEMSDLNITPQSVDLLSSCPPSLSYSPDVSPCNNSKSPDCPIIIGPSSVCKDSISAQDVPPILRSSHQRAGTISRTTSLEDFKTSTPAARRVSWADVFGQPSSLQTIVTYELSESDDEDNSVDSVDITDTSTTQGTVLSDKDDKDKREQSPAEKEHKRLNKVAASTGRSLLGRTKASLQTIQSNSSFVISDQSYDDSHDLETSNGSCSAKVSSFPHVDSLNASSFSPLDPTNTPRNFHQKNSMFKSIGRKLSSQPPSPSTSSNETGISALLVNPKLLVPTRLNDSSGTTPAANLGRKLMGRPRRTTS